MRPVSSIMRPASSFPACIASSIFMQAVVSLLCAAQIPAEMQSRIVRQIVGNFVIIISECKIMKFFYSVCNPLSVLTIVS